MFIKYTNNIKLFIKKLLIFFLPFFFIAIIFESLAIYAGELIPIKNVVNYQNNLSVKGLYGRKVVDQEFYNYKFNVDQEGFGDDYFDETSGFLSADFKYVKFKIGRDRINLGYGPVKTILGSNPPEMDYVHLNMNYKAFSFSYYHGQLLGTTSVIEDSIQGGLRNVTDKYFVYHRLGLNLSKHFTFGVGETVIYSRRNIDLAYLNPFNFYKNFLL